MWCYVCLLEDTGDLFEAITSIGGTTVCNNHVHHIANGAIYVAHPNRQQPPTEWIAGDPLP